MGWDEVRARVLRERTLLVASSTWPGGLPEEVQKAGDAPAGRSLTVEPTPMGQGTAVAIRSGAYEAWDAANVVRGEAKGTVSAYAWSRLGDVTSEQFRGLAAIQRELGAEVRLTNRQNLVFRGLSESQLPLLHERLAAIGMAEPGAELVKDVVACPGADTCNLAVTQSRGLASAIGDRLEEEGLGTVGGLRINISGCTNSCGQHHTSDIGFYGAERRAHGQAAPGYQMLLGGYVGQAQVHFGNRALRLPAKSAPDAAVAVVRRFDEEREAGESFRSWLDRVGGPKGVAEGLKDYGIFPAPEDAPEYYVDYGETGPYVAEIGEGECAAS
jgi:sulfite reductase beta subunit-like hemoprotein